MMHAPRYILVLLCLLAPSLAFAEDLYFGQSAAGGDTGANCANQHSAAWFNTAANWGGGAGEIDAGDTAHLCGTVTTALVVQGSGSAGNVITIVWETGAKLSLPFCDNSGGCFHFGIHDYVTLDGGTNGILEANANGTGLANQVDGNAINVVLGNQNIEIKNLTIQNCYVRAQNDATSGLDHARSIYLRENYSNFSYHDNTIHDCDGGGSFVAEVTTSNISIYNNNIYNVNAGIVMAGQSAITSSNISIYNNHIHDTANWDDPANIFHHNGIMLFGPPVACCASATIYSGVKIYNNLFDGNIGDHATSHSVYLAEAQLPDGLIFNNVVAPSNNPLSANGLFVIGPYVSDVSLYNNTIVCASSGANPSAVEMASAADTGSTFHFKNNLVIDCTAFMTFNQPNTWFAVDGLNYNLYAKSSANSSWKLQTTFYSTLAAWRTATGQEANSQYTAGSAGLNASYQPETGSIVINAGQNLSSLGITELNSDKAGLSRPQGSAWDIGAYEFDQGGSGQSPNPPGASYTSGNRASTGIRPLARAGQRPVR